MVSKAGGICQLLCSPTDRMPTIKKRMTSRPHRLKKTSSMKSKRRDLHHTWLHREKNGKLSFYCYSPRWITTAFFTKNVHVTSSVSSRVRTTDAAAVAATTLTIVTRRLPIAEVRVIYIYTFIRTQRTKCFSKANLTGLLSLFLSCGLV